MDAAAETVEHVGEAGRRSDARDEPKPFVELAILAARCRVGMVTVMSAEVTRGGRSSVGGLG